MARLHGPKLVSLFVILDADKLATFGGWLRLVVVSSLNTLYRLSGGLHTVFMLSEFAQLGKMQPVIAALGEGRARAKARGVKLGRRPKLTPHQKREALARREKGEETLAEIGRSYNVSAWTISRLTA
jgi:hypothetical protein